jgi:hypothetical protein
VAVRGPLALMLRTGWLVVRSTTCPVLASALSSAQIGIDVLADNTAYGG